MLAEFTTSPLAYAALTPVITGPAGTISTVARPPT